MPLIRIETDPSPRPDALAHAPLRRIDSDVLTAWGYDPALFDEPGRITLLVLASRLFADQQERIDLFRRAIADGVAEASVSIRRPNGDDLIVPARAEVASTAAGYRLRLTLVVADEDAPLVVSSPPPVPSTASTRPTGPDRDADDLRLRLLDGLALPDVGRSFERVDRFLRWVTPRTAPLMVVGAEGVGTGVLVEIVHEARGGGAWLQLDAELEPSELILEALDAHFGHGADPSTVAAVFVRRGDAGNRTVHRRVVAAAADLIQEAEPSRPRLYVTTHPDSSLLTAYRRDAQGDVFDLPNLSERSQDILPAISRLLRRARPGARIFQTIHPDAARTLQAYDWPGNVSEMRELAETVRLISGGTELRLEDLPVSFVARAEESGPGVARWTRTRLPARSHGKRGRPAKHLSVEEIRQALSEADGSRTHAAKLLGVSRTTLWRKIAEVGDDLFDDDDVAADEDGAS